MKNFKYTYLFCLVIVSSISSARVGPGDDDIPSGPLGYKCIHHNLITGQAIAYSEIMSASDRCSDYTFPEDSGIGGILLSPMQMSSVLKWSISGVTSYTWQPNPVFPQTTNPDHPSCRFGLGTSYD